MVIEAGELKKILIVDDEPDLLDILGIYFEGEGWKAEFAFNGQIALEKVKVFHPHVILSDINMPELDGLQLLEQLAVKGDDTPVIFITAFRSVEKVKRAWSLGAFDFVEKPADSRALVTLAENAFVHGREYVRAARVRSDQSGSRPIGKMNK
jgi:two-component system response regulator GlrR